MPKPRTNERIQGAYFVWILSLRNSVWQADGRSNQHNAGRQSLGTRDCEEAVRNLRELDLTKAVEFGLADSSLLKQDGAKLLTLEDGWQKYLEHVARPVVMGGAGRGTKKRYRAVINKFLPFAREKQVRYWQQVNNRLVESFGRWLDEEDYAGNTQSLELTTIKQAVKWMVAEGLLPAANLVTVMVKKPQGTDTYCYSTAEVAAIVELCRERSELNWMADVVIALATTGLRIGELVDLKWSNLDLGRRVLQLRDESHRARRSERNESQTTKTHRDRTLPINDDLMQVLKSLGRGPDGRVFHGPRGGKLKADTVRNVLKRDVLSELDDKFPVTPSRRGISAGRVHSFRHYFASVSADAGVPEQLLLSWLGHQESKMLRHYYHAREEVSRRHMEGICFLGTETNLKAATIATQVESEKRTAG